MIFAAGLGTRLRPFTDHHPKALAPLGEKPILQHVIEKMIAADIVDIIINIHHFGDQIKDFVKNIDCQANIVISDETNQLLDTGGGILHAAEYFDSDEPVLVHNADIYSNIDFYSLNQIHIQHDADVTLCVQPHRQSSRMLYFDNKNQLKGWQNIKNGEMKPYPFNPVDYKSAAFSGVHVISPQKVLKLMQDYRQLNGPVFSIIPFYLKELDQLTILGYDIPENIAWFDIGDPEKLQKANQYLSSAKSRQNLL